MHIKTTRGDSAGHLGTDEDARLRLQARNKKAADDPALREKPSNSGYSPLADECSKLDAAFEKAMAEEGMSDELAAWPKN